MSRISRNLSLLYRSERLIARRRLAVFQKQTAMMICAGLMAAIGVIMLNVAAYLALSGAMAPWAAAGIVAMVNLVLAGGIAAIASATSAEDGLQPVLEMRDLAIAELEADLEEVAQDARDLTRNVSRIARDPFGTALPALLGPLLSLLVKNAKK